MVTLDLSDPDNPIFSAPAVDMDVDLTFELVVDDGVDQSEPDTVVVTIINSNEPPSCSSAFPSKRILWPPNHTMERVLVRGVMDDDPIYNTVTLTIIGVTQDEPVKGHGVGHTSPDARIIDLPKRDRVRIRAERKLHGNGRVYQVKFTASDGFESCEGYVNVGVPRRKGHRPIDDGQIYDSTVE